MQSNHLPQQFPFKISLSLYICWYSIHNIFMLNVSPKRLFTYLIISQSFLFLSTPAQAGVERNLSIEDARSREQKAANERSPIKQFEYLALALRTYSHLYPEIKTTDFNWRNIVSKLIYLHSNDTTLKLKQSHIAFFCEEGSIESLKLLEMCIENDLVSFSMAVDDALPGLLMREIGKKTELIPDNIEALENQNSYKELAIHIILRSIELGATKKDFSPWYEPISEDELIKLACQAESCPLFAALIENDIISKNKIKNKK